MSKRSDKPHRLQVSEQKVGEAVAMVRNHLFRRLEAKGFGTWVSRHEILGFLTEEYHETIEAVHSGTEQDIKAELIDVAVGCIFGVACIDVNGLDW